MGIRYIYGQIDDSLIFLQEETVERLARLWSALSSALSWSDLRAQVGNELTEVVMRMAEDVSPTGADDPPFNRDNVRGMATACWSPFYLMQLMSIDLPFLVKEAGEMRYCRVNGSYLVISPSSESHGVLALVSEGFSVDRDDVAISLCVNVMRTSLTNVLEQPETKGA